jgi:hypothetical protein
VALTDLLTRNSRRSLLIEINPYQILAAGFSRPDQGSIMLDCAAEFDSEDDIGLRQWLDANFEKQKAWVPVICGFVSPEGLLQRESVLPRKLTEPDYLANLVREQYKIENPAAWKLQTLSPLEGIPLLPEGTQRPALICGMSHSDVHRVQQRLLDHRLLPYRLEQGILPLLGVISDYKTRRNDKRAVVVVSIEQEHTIAYILGKEGVHTYAPVRHGFAAIAQVARKEFGLTEASAVRERLNQTDEELLLRATKFVRAIGRDLKPLVDSYEMTTGQPVGEIYCAYLPPSLSWITEPLAQVVGRTPFTIDCQEWLATVNLQKADGVPAFAQHWLGALSLVAELPGPKPDNAPHEDTPYQGPWHIDCRLSAQLPNANLLLRRFLTDVIATTLAASALTVCLWQAYISNSLSADTAFWAQRIAEHQKLADELNQTTRSLSALSTRLDYAYDLMGAPYQVSDFILNLGRSRPVRMQIEKIDASESGLVMRGSLREPSEQASRTLRRYVEDLRADPAIGPPFAGIALTSLQREDPSDSLAFEITFKLKSAQP